jgi:[ribosomal protein S18]-alanine N-acetyltransferase
MINLSLKIRHAIAQDHDQIANLIFYEPNNHRHLDWHTPLEWIGSPNYWVYEEGGHISAVFACPEDPPHVAWIRSFGFHQNLSASQVWSSLWEVARHEMAGTNTATTVAAIVVKQWFQSILYSSGFELKQNIILLELLNQNIRAFSAPHGIRIRPMQNADLSAVAKVDFAAFGQFWHNTEDALQRACSQCTSATVAEDASGVIGYQLSTKNLLGAHLARLGVRPEAQGRGVGSALVSDLIQSLGAAELGRLSVNTQSDNVTSMSLYKKLGFVPTGEQFPVLVYPIGI